MSRTESTSLGRRNHPVAAQPAPPFGTSLQPENGALRATGLDADGTRNWSALAEELLGISEADLRAIPRKAAPVGPRRNDAREAREFAFPLPAFVSPSRSGRSPAASPRTVCRPDRRSELLVGSRTGRECLPADGASSPTVPEALRATWNRSETLQNRIHRFTAAP